jgi:TolB-like protein
MQKKLLQINLFGACAVRSCENGAFEITGAKHKALFALLATAPFGRRTRAFLQETLWGVACYDTGRQSLRRALADIKALMGPAFGYLITSTNAEVTLDLSLVQFVGRPGQDTFLEGLEIRESGFQQWLAGIRANPSQLDGIFSLSSRAGSVAILPTVAVLPFRAVTGEIADVTVGDWLAEEMCRSLSRSRLLSVISHLSARELASHGIDIAQVRSRLGADYCLVGSVRRSGPEFVLDADFVDVTSGRILWTRQFTTPIDGVMQGAESGIAAVVVAIGAAIADEALAHVAGRQLSEIEDQRLLIAGVKLMNRSKLIDLAKSRQLLEEAHRRAPHAAEPCGWLSKWYVLSVFNGWSTDVEADRRHGIDYAARALDLSPDNGFCLAMDGLVQTNIYKRLDLAEHRFNAAVTANPSEALSHLLLGTLCAFRDQGADAVRLTEKARRLSPLDPFRYYYEALSAAAYLSAGEFEKALAFADSSLMLNDRHTSSLRAKMVALHNLGRHEELLAAGRQLRAMTPELTVSGYLRSHPAAAFKFGQRGAEALRAAGFSEN